MRYGRTHGGSNTRLYKTWDTMRSRVFNKNDKDYPDYGGRGITVCEEWKDFAVFREWATNNGYTDQLTIERKQVNGNYCSDNCTFITLQEQARNRRNNTKITAWNETKILAQWIEDPRCKTNRAVLMHRIKNNWIPEDAISTCHIAKIQVRIRPGVYEAFGERKKLVDWAKDPRCKISYRHIVGRMSEGWSLEDALSIPRIEIRKTISAWGESKILDEWIKDDRCQYKNGKGILQRIRKGSSPENAISMKKMY